MAGEAASGVIGGVPRGSTAGPLNRRLLFRAGGQSDGDQGQAKANSAQCPDSLRDHVKPIIWAEPSCNSAQVIPVPEQPSLAKFG